MAPPKKTEMGTAMQKERERERRHLAHLVSVYLMPVASKSSCPITVLQRGTQSSHTLPNCKQLQQLPTPSIIHRGFAFLFTFAAGNQGHRPRRAVRNSVRSKARCRKKTRESLERVSCDREMLLCGKSTVPHEVEPTTTQQHVEMGILKQKHYSIQSFYDD